MPPTQAPEAPARKVKIDGRVKFTVHTQDPKPPLIKIRECYTKLRGRAKDSKGLKTLPSQLFDTKSHLVNKNVVAGLIAPHSPI